MKAAIYSRVSSQIQVDEGYSLEAQYDQLIKYVDMQSWDLVRIYTDPGVSAKDLNRPGVQEMINDLKDGKFEALIIHKLDRLTRNISDLYELVNLVMKHNIKLISLSENIDTSTAMGRMFIFMLGILAQMFRENLSEEVSKGLAKRADLGGRNTFAPYGYEIIDDGLVIVEEQAELIREVFRLLIENKMGYYSIAKHLNENKIMGLRGGNFHGSTIEIILNNHTYMGMNHWKRKGKPESERIIRDGGHIPIIDEETFNKAQDILGRRSRKEMSRSSYDYPYSTILKCGKCGSPYHGMNQNHKRNKPHYYYRCFKKTKGLCKESDISEMKFETLFFKHFNSDTPLIEFIEPPAAQENKDKERKKIIKELVKSEQRRKNWQYAYGDGKMPYPDYTKLIDEEMIRVSDLQARISIIPEIVPLQMTREDMMETIENIKEGWNLMERSTKKDFINSWFKAITIIKVDEVWNIVSAE